MRGMTITAQQSDIELLVGVRAGDARSGALLLERHRDAVAELGPSPAYSSVDASGRAALALVRSGQHELPFRAVWLGLHARGTLPDPATRDAGVWQAFLVLPTAWRHAVWYREVEGERAREIGHRLGMTEEQTTRALVSAYAALRHRAVLSHLTPGSPECERLLTTYRFSPSVLATAEVLLLREHGRHCDDCLEATRNLFVVEHGLREWLASTVLGAAAQAYLARRPCVARLRAPGAASVRSRRRLSPALGTFTAVTVGAATMALLLSTSVLSPVREGVPQVAAGAPAPGATLWPLEPPVRARGVRTPDPGTVAPVAVDGRTAVQGTGPQEGRGRGPGPAESQQPAPTTPVAPSAPEPAPTPTPSDGPGQAPDPGPTVSVDVDVSSEAVTVAVDPNPGPSDPIVVEVPVPDPVPEVEAPLSPP